MPDELAPLVLVVEDDPSMLTVLRTGLIARKYRFIGVTNGADGVRAATAEAPDVVVLDLNLPDIDGVEVCRRLRAWTDVPIIVLSAEGTESRKVIALDEGADDFVTKPFSMHELLARIRVAVRHRRARPRTKVEDAVHEVGDLRVDIARHEVSVAGRDVDLTPKEFDFLALLAKHPGKVLTHRVILQEVWGPAYGTETQYLRVYASQIRKKIGDTLDNPRLVTEPGVGYRLVDNRPATS